MQAMYLVIPYVPGIIAIIIGLIVIIRRFGYTKVKATIMTREHVSLQRSSNRKMLYIATYVYEYEGKRIERRNEKIKTTATDWEYIYLNKDGEIVDNANNRYSTLLVFGIMWIVAVFIVIKSGMLF